MAGCWKKRREKGREKSQAATTVSSRSLSLEPLISPLSPKLHDQGETRRRRSPLSTSDYGTRGTSSLPPSFSSHPESPVLKRRQGYFADNDLQRAP